MMSNHTDRFPEMDDAITSSILDGVLAEGRTMLGNDKAFDPFAGMDGSDKVHTDDRPNPLPKPPARNANNWDNETLADLVPPSAMAETESIGLPVNADEQKEPTPVDQPKIEKTPLPLEAQIAQGRFQAPLPLIHDVKEQGPGAAIPEPEQPLAPTALPEAPEPPVDEGVEAKHHFGGAADPESRSEEPMVDLENQQPAMPVDELLVDEPQGDSSASSSAGHATLEKRHLKRPANKNNTEAVKSTEDAMATSQRRKNFYGVVAAFVFLGTVITTIKTLVDFRMEQESLANQVALMQIQTKIDETTKMAAKTIDHWRISAAQMQQLVIEFEYLRLSSQDPGMVEAYTLRIALLKAVVEVMEKRIAKLQDQKATLAILQQLERDLPTLAGKQVVIRCTPEKSQRAKHLQVALNTIQVEARVLPFSPDVQVDDIKQGVYYNHGAEKKVAETLLAHLVKAGEAGALYFQAIPMGRHSYLTYVM